MSDTPTTARGLLGTTPTTAAASGGPGLALLRVELRRSLDVPDPPGFRLDTDALDRDADGLSPGLAEQFAGAGFVHGMVRVWFDGNGRRLSLAAYAFGDAAGARLAWSCGPRDRRSPGSPTRASSPTTTGSVRRPPLDATW